MVLLQRRVAEPLAEEDRAMILSKIHGTKGAKLAAQD